MADTIDVPLRDGRTVRVHDSGPADRERTLLWHHGSPQTGALLEPLVEAASARGIRLLCYARPSYGGSSPNAGRDVASAAGDVAQVLDHLGIEELVTMGASGGGPHALACAALLGDRITGVVTLAGIAPVTDAFDWYAGMLAPGGLRAAAQGREERAEFAATDEFEASTFIEVDWAALADTWASLAADAGEADAAGPDGLIDDDVAFTRPWGFDLAQIRSPVLVVQGDLDRIVPPSHAHSLIRGCPGSELWLRTHDSHVSILAAAPLAMDWLHSRCG